MLRLIYNKEPTLELYQAHVDDGASKLDESQQNEILKYLKNHGPTATAKHFSPKFKVVLNEAHIRHVFCCWQKWLPKMMSQVLSNGISHSHNIVLQ